MKRSPGRPSVAESANIHRRILSAATQEFMTAGYEDCSMNRIAHAAGSTKQTIYRLYPSKELLFKTVVATVIQEGVAQSADFRSDPREPAAVLQDAAARIQEIAADQTLVRLWRAADAVRRKFPELYLEVMEMVNQTSVAQKIMLYFEDLNRRGLMNFPHPDLAANHFTLLVGPASEIMNMRAGNYSEDVRVADVIGMFIRAYAREPAPVR